MKKVVVLLLGIFLVLGCAKNDGKKGQYLAKVGNTTITEEYLNKEIAALPIREQKMFKEEKDRSILVEGIILREILYQEAKKKGLDKDPIYPKKAENAQKTVLITFLLEKEIEDKATVSDKDVKEFYDKNKADFTVQGSPIEFDKIKGMLAQRLTAQKQKEFFDTYVINLKKSYKIEINEEAIAALSRKGEFNMEQPKETTKAAPKKEEAKKNTKAK